MPRKNGQSRAGDPRRPVSVAKTRQNHGKSATDVLSGWIQQHCTTFPGRTDKETLATQTGLTYCQVKTWFFNERKRGSKRDNDWTRPTDVLRTWIETHCTLYPNTADTKSLVACTGMSICEPVGACRCVCVLTVHTTGLTHGQVKQWFCNERRRGKERVSEPLNSLLVEMCVEIQSCPEEHSRVCLDWTSYDSASEQPPTHELCRVMAPAEF